MQQAGCCACGLRTSSRPCSIAATLLSTPPRLCSAPPHLPAESEQVEANIQALTKTYLSSPVSAALREAVHQLHATPGEKFEVPHTQPGRLYQTAVLTWRTFLNK